MDRRTLTAVLIGALLARPCASEAQLTRKLWRIGVLLNSSNTGNLEELRQGLREFGYVEGQSIDLEVVSAEGRLDRLPALASELVRRNVDLIVASGPQGVGAARHATASIPIVMGRMDDVDGHGFVTNLARPSGNITGLSFQTGELAGKQVELLNEAVPSLSRVVVIWDDAGTRTQLGTAQTGLRALRLESEVLILRQIPDLQAAISAAQTRGTDGLVMLASPAITTIQGRLATLALQRKLPAIYYNRGFPQAGGLMSYGPKASDFSWRHAAVFVDKILKGSKPAELPIEQPTKFELVINLKTAKTLGLAIPPSVLARADEVTQ